MQLTCPHCRQNLDFTSTPPSFCGYCGKRLAATAPGVTQDYTPAAGTPTCPSTASPAAGVNLAAAPTVPPHSSALISLAAAAQGVGDLPEVIGGYRLLRRLGSGGMGTVYEAAEESTGRHVAMKVIARHFAGPSDVVTRFKQEGRLASAIAHPRCVFVLGADEDHGRPYIVMELMPGDTLDDLVRRRGPLPPHAAITKILDVIEGLEEAHQQGVIHRDVKPSNCFLEADGRVKIGDFGLAKSLMVDSHLTKTGTFMGTPWFASPEQVKAENIDQQADVYSVAATLFYLLTGKPPFHSNDAMATLARIVADDPPSMRKLRPDLPRGLDKVVLRGLARDRKHRWRDLEQFRQALIPFMPVDLAPAGPGIRFIAYALDSLLVSVGFSILAALLGLLVGARIQASGRGVQVTMSDALAITEGVLGVVWVWLYFAIAEGFWGWSPGKWIMRLRVCPAGNSSLPSRRAAFVRATVFFGLTAFVPTLVIGLAMMVDPQYHPELRRSPAPERALIWLVAVPAALRLVGMAIVLFPMRRYNGYQGLHDRLSKTRVARLPWPTRRRVLDIGSYDLSVLHPQDLPAQIGPYAVRGALRWSLGDKLLLAADAGLGRTAWVRLGPPISTEPASDSGEGGSGITATRRNLNRVTRLRWLNGGTSPSVTPSVAPLAAEGIKTTAEDSAETWDAFLAPSGMPLFVLVANQGRLAWPETRQLLEDLADELGAACADGTLPSALTMEQVWVRPNGRIQLVDVPWTQSPGEPFAGAEQERALGLLRSVSVLALEGRERRSGSAKTTIQAPLPQHAQRVLDRLLGVDEAFGSVTQFHAALAATRDLSTEVTRPRRAWQLGVQAACLSIGLAWILIWTWILSFGSGVLTMLYIHELEDAESYLDAGIERELGAAAAGIEPWTRLAALAQLSAGLEVRQRLQQAIEHERAEVEARKLTADRMSLFVMDAVATLRQKTKPRIVEYVGADYVHRANQAISNEMPPGVEFRDHLLLSTAVLAIMLFWPGLWVAWAFVMRGGLTYRLSGIALVRSNGRPALRVQCAWRALLVWLPFIVLLLLAIELDDAYWAHWSPSAPMPENVWTLWLSWGSWWLALLLLPVYIGLALRYQARGIHDRLAGTHLVPR